uniref:FAD-binding FR-type domain-containing protein n=1 Tax=Hyaloperonospora arabidopsidis (strain Emoy2) TaxID=559515 RepID=M4BN15_HYAAE
MIFTLLWIRWPLYYNNVYPSVLAFLDDRLDVEPVVVSFALVLPFLCAGTVFHWRHASFGSSLVQRGQQLKLIRWLKTYPSIGQYIGVDGVDVVVGSGFFLLQLNLVIGKLLTDNRSGKLATSGYLKCVARELGMNGLYTMVMSLLLVSRQSFLHKCFGLSSERATRYHVISGQWGFFLSLLHGVWYIMTWYLDGKLAQKLLPCVHETCTPAQQYTSSRNFFGAVAMGALLIVAVSSLARVRRQYFRRFIALHTLNVVVVLSTALHYYATSFWMVPAIMLYGSYRSVSMFGRGKASVVSTITMSNKVYQLELGRGATVVTSDFVPGQYVYLQVAAIGKEWHPFSISSSPLRNRHSFVVDVKVQGAFTSRLLTLLQKQQLHTVHVDGYYGSGIKLAPHMVLVAGGSGMTPFLSILDHMKALADARDRDEGLMDGVVVKLPRTVWVVWTCRDLGFMAAYAELLDTVKRCSRWKCKVWLHLTFAESCGREDEDEDDDTQTEPDDLSEESTPRVQQFYPAPTKPFVFSGHNSALGLPLFVGTALGCGLLMWWVYHLEELSARSFTKRLMLLLAGALGAVLGAGSGLYLQQCWNARKGVKVGGSNIEVAMGEMEAAGFGIMSPATPSGPHSMPSPAQSLQNRSFVVEKKRPDLGSRLRYVHGEIQENYGTKAEVALLVSGPAALQQDVLLQSRKFLKPAFDVEQKSFLL